MCFAVLIGYYAFNVFQVARAIKLQAGQAESFIKPAEHERLAVKDVGLPVRLRIPVIGVDAAIETVGQTAAGLMDVPKDDDNVAWYQLGQRPGEIGSAVIDGHYGVKGGRDLVFEKLDKLLPGDKIYIEDDMGVITTFSMRTSQSFEALADASSVFYSNDNQAHLNLITCDGRWNTATKSFPQRLVIFADLK